MELPSKVIKDQQQYTKHRVFQCTDILGLDCQYNELKDFLNIYAFNLDHATSK